MKPLFLRSTVYGTIHILPYTDYTGVTVGWFVGNSTYPVMRIFRIGDLTVTQQEAILYAIKRFNIDKEFLRLYCLALNNGWALNTHYVTTPENAFIIDNICAVLNKVEQPLKIKENL